MIDFDQLEYLAAIVKHGTLSKAAEELHLSQPSLSRAMSRLEETLGVVLFDRQKNRVKLNKCGELAFEHATMLLAERKRMINDIRLLERRMHTISLGMCTSLLHGALLQLLSQLYPEMTISTEMRNRDELLKGLRDRVYTVIIVDHPPTESEFYSQFLCKEHLFFLLHPTHPLSSATGLRFSDIDGEDILIRSPICNWNDTFQKELPNTHFIYQNEQYAYEQFLLTSTISAFTSDVHIREEIEKNERRAIPILDDSAVLDHYLVCHTEDRGKLSLFFEELGKQQF
ncbi:MAG: LysR family transcriptional regulator [Clostridia bacterium]|nr:LysR family transcriptional regulator [Clostridia bacterium]